MQWLEKYAIGIEKIDDHHQQLVALITKLEDAQAGGRAAREMGQVLKALVDYTKYHFREEEHLMGKVQYAELDAQKKMHKTFVDEIVKILQRIQQAKPIDPGELLEFLKDWLINHILKEDCKIGEAHPGDAEKASGENRDDAYELERKLEKLATLCKKGLITAQDQTAKRENCLAAFAVFEGSVVNDLVQERLDVLERLAAKKLIPEEERQHYSAQIYARYDLEHALEGLPEIEEKLALLKLLHKKKLLGEGLFSEHKEKVLDGL